MFYIRTICNVSKIYRPSSIIFCGGIKCSFSFKDFYCLFVFPFSTERWLSAINFLSDFYFLLDDLFFFQPAPNFFSHYQNQKGSGNLKQTFFLRNKMV